MGESIGIDSLLGGWAMPKAYSGEMRERVIAEVESGASRREAAEEFAVSASTAVIWVKCFRQNYFQKKACTQRSKSARTWRGRAGAGCENRACLIPPGWSSLTRPPPIPRWCG